MRRLIVNADDCNLTAGVTRGILECYEKGIVSSTTWIANRPCDFELAEKLAKCGIGVGLHLNVTSGKPLSSKGDVSSLVDDAGDFKRKPAYLQKLPTLGDLVKEYTKQITLFQKIFNRLPTHMDTHHQMHDDPFFMQALAHIANKYKLPVRRSVLMQAKGFSYPELRTTQFLFGNLSAHEFWTFEKLEKVLSTMLPGTAEIMCHPGIWTTELQQVTSMTVAREKEHALFASERLKRMLQKFNIQLIHFGSL